MKCECRICAGGPIEEGHRVSNRTNKQFRRNSNKAREQLDREWKEFMENHSTDPRNKVKPWGAQEPSRSEKEKSKWEYYEAKQKTQSKVDTDTMFAVLASDVAVEIVQLITSKQKDYGPEAINSAPFGPLKGLITRLHDKLSRAVNITKNEKKPDNESLRDTFIDIAGYAIISVMLLDDKFPKGK